ncbi:MAG TPA: hypothetical protein VHO71_04600 [Caproiciproducens sp.]|nr:hypothetical protein [Caproiciproducens sp.]
MKKRNCRRTQEEIELHRQAVEIRKMTDVQLCRYISGLKGAGAQAHDSSIRRQAVEDFLSGIQPGNGIGQATRGKLWDYARENGFLPVNEKGG